VVAGTNYFGEIISWKTTTKFMERPGCRRYIFGNHEGTRWLNWLLF